MSRVSRSLLFRAVAGIALSLSIAPSAQAQLINFDDLSGRGNFWADGIQLSYHGFHWGTSLYNAQSGSAGWGYGAAGTIDYIDPMPVSSPMVAWTWDGPRSLFIDFLAPTNVTSAWFASLYPAGNSGGSHSMTMYGYDNLGNVVATSSTLALTHTMQQINAGFSGVYALELRSDRNGSWFVVDDIQLNVATVVPEPGTWALMLAGLAATGVAARRRRKA